MKAGTLVIVFIFLFLLQPENLFASGNNPYANESIIVHIDRDLYISGESLFFKLYVIDENTHKLSAISKTAYMVLRDSKSKPIANISMKINNGMAYGNIYLHDTLASGGYQLVAFTNWMRNHGEASFYYKEVFIANLFDKELSMLSSSESHDTAGNLHIQSSQNKPENPILLVSADKPGYAKNEKVVLKIAFKTPDPDNSTTLSVSVSETSPIADRLDANNVTQLDLKSEEVKNIHIEICYLPEIKGRIISGKVLNRETNKGESNCTLLLSAIDTAVNLQYAGTDSSGVFQFLLNDYYNNKEFVISIINKPAGKHFSIVLDNKFKIDKPFHPATLPINDNFRSFVNKSQDIVFVQKNYGMEPKISVQEQTALPVSSPLIYYKPSSTVYPSDFVSLPDFTEISRELLPTVKIRKTEESYSLELTDLHQQGFFTKKPAVFLNSVMIDDVSQIIPLGSNQVKRIEVMNMQAVKGSLIFEGGILAVFTKEKEIPNLRLNPEAMHKTLEPYMPVSELETKQDPVKQSKNNPDFRQLLYWNPDIAISGNEARDIGFYASGHTGTYCIKIEGVTSKGEIINSTTTITIH